MMASSLPTTPHAIKRIKANELQNFEPVLRVSGRKLNVGGKVQLDLSDGSDIITAVVVYSANLDDFPINVQIQLSGTYPVSKIADKVVLMLNQPNITVLGMASPDSIMSNAMETSSVSFSDPVKPMHQGGSSSFNPSAYVGGAGTTSYTTPYKSASSNNSFNQNQSSMSTSPISASAVNTIPISMLNPYSNKWTIRARVTAKAEIKSWTNAKGSGSFFSVDLLDNDETAIRAMFWREACDKFYPMLELNCVYFFSQGRVKLSANSQMSNTKNKYELDFSPLSTITPCEDDSSIKAQKFNFVKIKDLISIEVNNTIDLLCIVKSASDVQEITLKSSGKISPKRDLTVVDDSNAEVRVTLWGEKAISNCDWKSCPIVLFTGLKVGEYGGRTLSSMNTSQVQLNPDMEQARQLHEFRCQFSDGMPSAESISNQGPAMEKNDNWKFEKRIPIQHIKENNIGVGSDEKGVFVNISGYVEKVFHEKDPWYTACPDCNKKVIADMSGNNWSCEKCQKTFEQPVRRYILTIRMHDYSGSSYLSIFDKEAIMMLGGHTADMIHEMRLSGNTAAADKIFDSCLFDKQFVCSVRAREELVKEERKVKSQIIKIDQVDFIQQNKSLLAAINKYY